MVWKLTRVLGGCVRKDTPLLTQGDHSQLLQRFQYLLERVEKWEKLGEDLLKASSEEGAYGYYLLKEVIQGVKNIQLDA